MIRISIGTVVRQWNNLNNIEESWIAQQITRRRQDGNPVCVTVFVQSSSPMVDIRLISQECAASGGGGRLPNDEERRIFDLWERHGRKHEEIRPGDVTSFLRQLGKIV